MSYLVLARKWRPKTFSDLVGQEHVAQTLRNAIAHDRVAQAFLFTGARGVGKTTIARIMAKALNCLGRESASAEPCLKCAACVEIAEGRDPDVYEIDGASNNGVEDMRRLQESLPYRPARDRYKVIIIDECHMVSNSGWNALLKTLEEPYPHVKFIFATTEAHKLLATILSRVQRYDFRLIPTQKIRDRLAYILREEGLGYEDPAVALISREAAGSMRDALSLLDQVIAGVERDITTASTARLLGVADRKVLYELTRAMLKGDAAAALRLIDVITREGYDLPNVAKGLLNVLRDLVVARVVADPSDLLDVADEEQAEVSEIAKQSDVVDLERLFVAWARVTEDVARAREPRWVIEMAAVRLAHRPALVPVDELLGKMHELERRLSGDASRPRGGGSGGGGGGGGGGGPRPSAPTAASGPTSTGPVGPRSLSTSVTANLPASQRFTPPTASIAGNVAVAPVVAAPAPAPVLQPVVQRAPDERSWLDRARASAPEFKQEKKAAAAPVASPQAAEKRSEGPRIDASRAAEFLAVWREVVAGIDGNLVPVLKSAVAIEVTAQKISLAIDAGSAFLRRKLETPETLSVVREAATRVFGAPPKVEVLPGSLAEDALSIMRADELTKIAARQKREDEARSHPLVQMVCSALGGEVAKVRLEDEPG
ncbi:MAG: DNA polymerase III subunit gamma/tau [Myxococcales bacterium]|nr:DNA polymerase III subunit gamma/tau [Myxococcales bacterium]